MFYNGESLPWSNKKNLFLLQVHGRLMFLHYLPIHRWSRKEIIYSLLPPGHRRDVGTQEESAAGEPFLFTTDWQQNRKCKVAFHFIGAAWSSSELTHTHKLQQFLLSRLPPCLLAWQKRELEALGVDYHGKNSLCK